MDELHEKHVEIDERWLSEWFELAWCSGWEEKADEHLPALLGVPVVPHLSFDRNPGRGNTHWKLAAIEAHAGERPVAWIDDALDERCDAWAARRNSEVAPTLLVHTEQGAYLDGLDDGTGREAGWRDLLEALAREVEG